MGIPESRMVVSVEEYLRGEPLSGVRHEYIGGQVFAMAGATQNHNAISGNFFGHLWSHLRGKSCRVFMSDMKARLMAFQQDVFYYPDVMVSCDERDTNAQFIKFPKLIIEVLSKSTQRVDRLEKFSHYVTIPTLEEYVLAEQSRLAITIFRRRTEWKPELFEDPQAHITLESVELKLPLKEFYENVIPAEEHGDLEG